MSLPRNYLIPNQYINRLINEQDPIFPPIIVKYPPGYTLLFNDAHDQNSAEDDHNDYTDNPRNDK